jgi:hypothetical protein
MGLAEQGREIRGFGQPLDPGQPVGGAVEESR